MEAIALAAVLLFALLVGIAVPVLLQLRATLKRADEFIATTSVKANAALTDVAQLSTRINRVLGEIEANLPRLQRAVDAADGIVSAVERFRGPLRAAAAIGPAAFAAAKSLISSFVAARTQAAAASYEPEREPAGESQHASVA